VELGEFLSADRLSDLIEQGCTISVLQRLGWLLDHVGWQEKAEGLHAALAAKRLSWSLLDTRLQAGGPQDPRWRIIINTEVQPDIER
jgi:hypothetical protein